MSIFRGTLFILFLAGLSACTDKREPEKKLPVRVQRAPKEILETVGDIRITKGATTANITVFQMLQKNGSIYVTGTADNNVPLGFARWDISSDPESPTPLFNIGENYTDFDKIGRWRPDWYGSGAIGILGNYAVMSGVVGSSFISLAQPTSPVELKRYPMIDPAKPETPQDPEFVYRGIAMHPTQPLMYGLKESDHIVVSSISASGVTKIRQVPYGAGSVCCVQGATVFGNQMFVGMRGMLRAYDLAPNGDLSLPIDIHGLQAVNVASTADLLYIQHNPSFGNAGGTDKAAGIYVFDRNGDSIAFLPVEPIRFVVSDDNTHLYANMDDTSVRIFRIAWTNR